MSVSYFTDNSSNLSLDLSLAYLLNFKETYLSKLYSISASVTKSTSSKEISCR